MKKLLFLLTYLLISICVSAQDIIVTNKAQKIDAKILEVSTSEIRYKELDNLDGPVFVLSVDKINSIIFANGKVVLYNQPNDVQKSAKIEDKDGEVEAIARANAIASLFNQSGTSDSDNSQGSEVKGTPIGYNLRDGNVLSLAGRYLVDGKLPMPSNNFMQEGKVVVQIHVNAAGDVIEAKIIGGDVNDKQTQQLALDAAKKAKFTEGDHDQIGTITYIFKLN